jgi:short-subunit dehydrogenase
MTASHVLVTGAAGAIGAALAEAFARRHLGARTTLVDVDEAGTRRVADRLGGDVDVRIWDLSELERLPSLAGELTDARGPVDLLVNCAGFLEVRSFASMPWELGTRLLRVDLESPLRLMSLVVPSMVERGSGVVVNVASMAGLTPIRGCSYYGASKAGLAMASEIAHLELAPRGVHVVTVYPGPVRSALESKARRQYPGRSLARVIPAGDPDVLARKVVVACDRRRSRVVYPPVYDLVSRFPAIASGITRTFSPAPSD